MLNKMDPITHCSDKPIIWCFNSSEHSVHKNTLIVNLKNIFALKMLNLLLSHSIKTQRCVLLMTLHIVTGRNGLQRNVVFFIIYSQLE